MNYNDIVALTERIAEVAAEWNDNADAYDNPCVHIYLDDNMTYQAELVEESTIPADNDREDYYCLDPFFRTETDDEGNDHDCVDYEYCEDIANNYIFLEH